MQKVNLENIPLFQFKLFLDFSSIGHFSTCKNKIGENQFSMSLSSVKNPEPIIENRKLLAKELGLHPENFVFQQQEHTNHVKVVKKEHKGKGFYSHLDGFADNDAMITAEKKLCMMVMGADCVPVLFYDPVKGVIGSVHAGWRGTVQSIASATIKVMQKEFACNPSDIIAGIGPSIGQRNYEVDDLVFNAFSNAFDYSDELFTKGKKPGKYQLDLWKANKMQLLKVGLKEDNIEVSAVCTFHNNKEFFSARRGDSGRFASGIFLL